MSIARRFWFLVSLVLGSAILFSALAVWFTATPFLESLQRRTIAEQAEKDVRAFENQLALYGQLLTYVASQDDVVSVAMGYVDNVDVVHDFIARLDLPEGIDSLTLFDAFGEEIARVDLMLSVPSQFSEARFKEIKDRQLEVSQTTLGKPNAAPDLGDQLRFVHGDGKIHILYGVPVFNRGFAEGVLVGEFTQALDQVFPPSEIASRTTMEPEGALQQEVMRGSGDWVEPMAGGAAALVLKPATEIIAAAGRGLLTTVVASISAVLFVAFSVFALLGRTTIVEPHRRLSAQKAELDELAAIARNANDAILVTDLEERIVWGNPAFEALSGYSVADVEGKKPGSFLQGSGTDRQTLERVRKAIRSGRPMTEELLNYTKAGKPYWIRMSIAPLLRDSGETYGFVATSSDITLERHQRAEIEKARRETEFQARHDSLTGLPNRRFLQEEMDERLLDPERLLTVVRIDLDHFKHVNDTMGHAAGDHVLQEVAKILKRHTRQGDIPARVGGDEFILVLDGDAGSAHKMSTRIQMAINEPMSYGGKPVHVGASFGIAMSKSSATGAEDLISCADAALYKAKDLGRNKVITYDSTLHEAVRMNRELAVEVQDAIENEEFEPFFQPQINVSDGSIHGVEALARWRSPKRGLVTPDVFLPVAEQLSVVEKVDEIIFGKGLTYINEMRDAGHQLPKISFNITGERIRELTTGPVLPEIRPGDLQVSFEILESVLVERQTDDFRFAVDTLRDRGYTIEVDDFGSGHASIIGLLQINPEYMKIDRRLVIPVLESDTSKALLSSIIDMAKALNVRVVAEGIETEAHAKLLTSMGCDVMQGFHFAKPLDRFELSDFLSRHAANRAA